MIDRCLQLHGGYGYMREYPIAKAYMDSRVQTIYGGTTEIMKEIIGRGLNLDLTARIGRKPRPTRPSDLAVQARADQILRITVTTLPRSPRPCR